MDVLNKGSLGRRILKRLISFVIVIWGVVTLSFCLQVFTGTDPAEMIVRKNSIFATEEQIQAVREQLGLDAPFHERYFDYITGVATGDLGTAITNRQPVIENIKAALPVTCTVIVMAMAWVVLFAVILSAISVIRKNGIFDNVTRIICIIGICVPSFWLALILLTAFAVNIPIFNVIADGSIKSLILPSIAMAVPIICISARVLRASVLNELKSDYVLFARARGFSNSQIVFGEVLRNALPAAITLFAQYCAALFGTSALVESVFSIDGLGIYLMESCESMDVYGMNSTVKVNSARKIFCRKKGSSLAIRKSWNKNCRKNSKGRRGCCRKRKNDKLRKYIWQSRETCCRLRMRNCGSACMTILKESQYIVPRKLKLHGNGGIFLPVFIEAK